jgi:hypothetical protein
MTEGLNPLWRLTDPYSGALERDLPLATWIVPPELKLQDGWLVYERRPFFLQEEPVLARIQKNILFDFSELAEADDSRVLNYARKFGVLGLCEHGKPLGHITRMPIEKVCTPLGWPRECREPIERWRFFALGFRAVLRISVALHEGKNGDAEDWTHALNLPRIAERGAPWAHVVGIVNHLMSWAAVQPYWILRADNTMGMELRASVPDSALFATLVTELLFTITQTKGLLICSDCGRFFLPKHPPRTGVRRFCERCGVKAAWRSASTDYRRRKRTAWDEKLAMEQKAVSVPETLRGQKPAKNRSGRKRPISGSAQV